MNSSILPYFAQLKSVSWCENGTELALNTQQMSWLQEPNSLTKRLKGYCQALTVEVVENRWVDISELSQQEVDVLGQYRRYLLREVVIFGDDEPWVLGQSLVAEPLVASEASPLANLGDTPLGDRVFRSPSAKRDYLRFGQVENFYARSSRLWLDNLPVLVSELFLSGSPIYQEEKQ
jgi:chorismate--pyruvate lyase